VWKPVADALMHFGCRLASGFGEGAVLGGELVDIASGVQDDLG